MGTVRLTYGAVEVCEGMMACIVADNLCDCAACQQNMEIMEEGYNVNLWPYKRCLRDNDGSDIEWSVELTMSDHDQVITFAVSSEDDAAALVAMLERTEGITAISLEDGLSLEQPDEFEGCAGMTIGQAMDSRTLMSDLVVMGKAQAEIN